MARPTTITVRAYTNRFLGTVAKGRELIRLLEEVDGARWVPQRWSTAEPIRRRFGPSKHDDVLAAWSEARPRGSCQVTNTLWFRRTRPGLLLDAMAWRSVRPWMNHIWAEFDASVFDANDGPRRVRQIAMAFVSWTSAVHATAFHSAQAHGRSGPGSPLEGLRRVDWLTYWGSPYVQLVGRERLLRAPCESAEEYDSGVMMIAAPRFDDPKVRDSETVLLNLEEYLGEDLFAGRDYPRVPCRIPSFDMSETVCDVTDARSVPRPALGLAADPSALQQSIRAWLAEAERLAAARGIILDYSPSSIARIEDILEDYRRESAVGSRTLGKHRLALAFGAYVGEVLRTKLGGRWELEQSTAEGHESVALQCGATKICPIDKIHRRLARGDTESLLLYVAAVLQAQGRPREGDGS